LRSITISLPFTTFSEDELASAFDAYPHVQEITIRGGLLQDFRSEGKCASAAKAIALRCPSLQKLKFRNFDRVKVARPNVNVVIERRVGEEVTVSMEVVDQDHLEPWSSIGPSITDFLRLATEVSTITGYLAELLYTSGPPEA